MTDKAPLELISTITEFNDLHEFMKDEHLDKTLAIVVKLLMNPDVPATKAPELIITLQALSTKFAIQARYYTSFEKGTEASKKKNLYYTVNSAIDKLVDALFFLLI